MNNKNIENLLEITKQFLKEKTTINNFEQWQDLLRFLNKNKIITLEDMSNIEKSYLIFPMSLEQFIRVLTEAYNDEKTQHFINQITILNSQLNDVKSTVNYWNLEGMNHQELKCLLIIFEKIKKGILEVKDSFSSMNDQLQTSKEGINYLKDQFIKQMDNQEILTSCDYQKTDGFSIQKEFTGIRIRNVQYRNQKVKVLDQQSNGIIKQIGYDIDLDFPVEVIKIPKMFNDFEVLETYLYSFDAFKELTFSKYFQNYLGFNNLADPNYNLYFVEFIKSKSLNNLLENANNKLTVNMPLFRLWIREIFLAFKDLLSKSTYMPKLPIKLKNIWVANDGLKIILKDIKFLSLRKLKNMCSEKLEAKLLENFAQIIIQILGQNQYEVKNLEYFDNQLEFKSFVIALLNSSKDLQKFLDGQTTIRLQFDQLLNHHLLNEQYIIETDVLELINTYEQTFENQKEDKLNQKNQNYSQKFQQNY